MNRASSFSHAKPAYLDPGVYWLSLDEPGMHAFEMYVPRNHEVQCNEPLAAGLEWHAVPTPPGNGPITQRGGCYVRPVDTSVTATYRFASTSSGLG